MSERAIKKPKEFEDFIQLLVNKTDKDAHLKNYPFKNYAQVMAFVASIGAKLCPEKFKDDYPVDSDKDPIRFEIFKNQGLDEVIKILAVHKEENLNVLTSEGEQRNEKIKIFEGYAYAGLTKLKEVIDKPGLPLDNLVEFIKENIEDKEETQTSHPTDLDTLFSS